MADPAAFTSLDSQWSSPLWRLNNLYEIEDEQGRKVPFRMNTAQERFFSDMHFLNLILKARQLGFSTLIDLYILDQCVFNSHTKAGIIAHNLEDAKKLFATKIRFPYEHLDEGIRSRVPAVGDSKTELELANSSSISVGTSHRSGTLQILHISEYGKICSRFPDKADEIRTGALNTVAPGQMAFIESTAEGKEGDFYNRVQRARAQKDSGSTLTTMDWKFHFYPWFEEKRYNLAAQGVVVGTEEREYFAKLAAEGIALSTEQMAWYVKKAADQADDMRKEFPSTPDEAFEQAIEGAYFAKQMQLVRKQNRICRVPLDARLPVNTFWDLGHNDTTNIWLHQNTRGSNHFVGYYYNSGEELPHYVRWLKEWGNERNVVWGKHYMPHDAENTTLAGSVKNMAMSLGFKPVVIVERVHRKMDAVEAGRGILSTCVFDEAECSEGIKHLEHYRKDWNDLLGVWRDTPRHDENSHGADAFMTFACGFKSPFVPSRPGAYSDKRPSSGPPSSMAV